MFTPKERLKRALKGYEVDRPPCICPGGMMNMVVAEVMDLTGSHWPKAHKDSKLMADLTRGIYKSGGFENFGVPFCMTVEAEAMGAPVFLGTKINEPRVKSYPINSVTEWRKLKRININEGRVKVTIEAIKILKEKNSEIPVIANLTGPVSLASSLMEPTVYYKELRKRPRKAHEMMTFVTKNLIEFGKAQLEAGANVLVISDPSGTGEILGPKTFKEFAVTYLNKITESLSDLAEVGTIIHICGKLKSVYEEINLISSDAISFDSITSVHEVVKNVKNKAIMGNVSTFALENNSADNVKTIAKTCIKNGANILSPACGIGPKTSLENIRFMVKGAKECKDKSFQF